MKIISILVVCLYSILLLSTSAQDKPMMETYLEKAKNHRAHSKKLFQDEKWDELEKLLNNSRDKKLRTTYGSSLFSTYYQGLRVFDTAYPVSLWDDYKAKLMSWKAAKPDSLNQAIIEMYFWTKYSAMLPRDADAQQTKLRKERLAKSEEIYTETVKKYGDKPVPCPQFYESAMAVGFYNDWSTKKAYDELIVPVLKNWGDYHSAYSEYTLLFIYYRGGGDRASSAVFEFYVELQEKLGGDFGKEVMAYCIFEKYGFSLNGYRYDIVDQDDMLEGLLLHIKRNPNDVDLIKRVAVFSSRYGIDAMRVVLKGIREVAPITYSQFVKFNSYGKALNAMMETPGKSVEQDYYFRPDSSSRIVPIISASSQDDIAYTVYAQGPEALVVIRNKDSKILAIESPDLYRRNKTSYQTVALSKSGDRIFVELTEKGLREFRIYSFENNTLELIKTVPSPLGFGEYAEFSDDGETVLIAGEEKGSNFKISLYYRWKWKTEKPQLITKSKRVHTTKMEINHANKQVFCYSGKDFFHYNYAEEKPEIHPIDLQIDGVKPEIYDIHYAKEIDSLVLVTKKHNALTVLDPLTFEARASMKLKSYPALATLVDGYQDKDGKYALCVSGNVGFLSIYHYNDNNVEKPFSLDGTWISGNYDATYLNVVETKDEPTRIMQVSGKGSMLSSYSEK